MLVPASSHKRSSKGSLGATTSLSRQQGKKGTCCRTLKAHAAWNFPIGRSFDLISYFFLLWTKNLLWSHPTCLIMRHPVISVILQLFQFDTVKWRPHLGCPAHVAQPGARSQPPGPAEKPLVGFAGLGPALPWPGVGRSAILEVGHNRSRP